MSEERVPRTIYDLGVALARIEGKVDNLFSMEARNDERHNHHEKSLEALEKNFWKAVGGLGALTSLPWLLPLGKQLFSR